MLRLKGKIEKEKLTYLFRYFKMAAKYNLNYKELVIYYSALNNFRMKIKSYIPILCRPFMV